VKSLFIHGAHLIRLSNQTGTGLLVLPSLWALVLASNGIPNPTLFVVFLVGAFLLRSTGVVVNDLVDRSIDRQVRRTKHRPLATGILTPFQAILILFILLLPAAGLLWFLNPLAIRLCLVAILFIVVYPFAKRLMTYPQLVLGLAFGWGAVIAWAAVRNTLEVSTWCVYGATICWTMAYDTIYALQDKEDDMRIGIQSSAIALGDQCWIGVGIFSGLMLALLGTAGWLRHLGWPFYTILAGAGLILGNQVLELRGNVSSTRSFELFRQHTWIGAGILLGMFLGVL